MLQVVSRIAGSHSLKVKELKSLQVAIMSLDQLDIYIAGTFINWPKFDAKRRHLFNIASVRFLLVDKKDIDWGQKQIEHFRELKNILKVYENESLVIFENLTALPRIYFINSFKPISYGDFEQAKLLLSNSSFNPYQDSIIECSSTNFIVPSSSSSVYFSQKNELIFLCDEPNRIEIKLINRTPGLLILNDTYYHGWRAYVDQQEKPILPANIMMRAVYIANPGEHIVCFKF